MSMNILPTRSPIRHIGDLPKTWGLASLNWVRNNVPSVIDMSCTNQMEGAEVCPHNLFTHLVLYHMNLSLVFTLKS